MGFNHQEKKGNYNNWVIKPKKRIDNIYLNVLSFILFVLNFSRKILCNFFFEIDKKIQN